MRRPTLAWLAPSLTAFGRKFGIDTHYYAKNSSLVFLGHVVGLLRGLVTGYLVARLFSQEIYGQYQFMLSVVGMLSIVSLSKLPHSVTRAWARGDVFSVRRIIGHQFLICMIGSCILFGAIPFLSHYGREELRPLFLLAGVLFPLPPIAMVLFGGYTVGQARFDVALQANIVWSISMVLATLLVIVFDQSAFWMLLIAMAVPSVVYLLFIRDVRPPSGKPEQDNTRGILRYAWQLTFATLPTELVWYVDKLLVSHFFGLNQLAVFSVALLIPEQAKLFFKQFIPISFAKQAKGDDSIERRNKLFRIVLVGMGFFAAGVAVYIALAPTLMPILFPLYDSSEVIFLTSVAAVTIVTIPAALISQYLEAQGMIRENRRSNWISAAVFAVLLVWLVPTYGLLGAILARGGFRLLTALLPWWFLMRRPIES